MDLETTEMFAETVLAWTVLTFVIDEFIFEDVINMSALFVVVFDDSIVATFVAVKVTLDVFAIGFFSPNSPTGFDGTVTD